MKRTASKIFLISLFALSAVWLAAKSGLAQTGPEFMVTWSAETYVPPGFRGKTLPTRGTTINLSLELINENKLVDLSGKEIRYLVNNEILKSGLALKNFSFSTPLFASGDQTVKITILNYKGENLEKRLIIPLVSPEVVIDAPYDSNKIKKGAVNIFKALSYFFNIRNLNELDFEWSANNVKTSGVSDNPDILELNVPAGVSGQEIVISATAAKKDNPLESGATRIITKVE